MFDRPEGGEKAILVHVAWRRAPLPEEQQEFEALALAAGANICGRLSAPLRTMNPRFLIGSGKLDQLKSLAETSGAELILIDHQLSPGQERNLEGVLGRRIVDRAGLILDIFAQRARTFEGKLQVELAQLEHVATRLVRGWTHLERQKGGIGLRGPGETQLETDRRLVSRKIRQLQDRLQRLDRHRNLSRGRRGRNDIPTVSLVGYTNAGKSTLFNALTDAGVLVADMLFATLDPTLRGVDLPTGERFVLADTVGFVRDLPHELVAAFRSTLEETRAARLLLHVIDGSDPVHPERVEDVEKVLQDIGAGHLPMLRVYNKADRIDRLPRMDRAETGMPASVWLSASTGAGLDLLRTAIAEFLHQDKVCGVVRLTVAQARLRAMIYSQGTVQGERPLEDGGWELDVVMDRRGFMHLQRLENLHIQKDGSTLIGTAV